MPQNSLSLEPQELLPLFQERVWGRQDLAPFYPSASQKQRIGEVWFTFKENRIKSGERLGDLVRSQPFLLGNAFRREHPDVCPLLVKMLFTTERLSVQVHPKDDYAQQHHQSLGKTEAWYVVHAEPHGEVAVGFKEQLSPERFAESIKTGEIERLLDWRRVKAGDTIFVPAGTVHAIGAGVVICEVQQNSDITYRLYDYGRPRELHLEHGVKVSDLGPHHYRLDPVSLAPGREELVSCDYFRIEKLNPKKRVGFSAGCPNYLLLMCLAGEGQIAGQRFAAGRCWFVPARANEFTIEGAGSEWILSYASEQPWHGVSSGD